MGGGVLNFPQRQQTHFKQKGFFPYSIVGKFHANTKKRMSYKSAPKNNVLGTTPISAFATEQIILLSFYLNLKYTPLSVILYTWKSQSFRGIRGRKGTVAWALG